MAENTTPAVCSEAVYKAARSAGVLIVTTGEEAAIQRFADAIYAMGYSDAIDFVATGESKDSRESCSDCTPPAAGTVPIEAGGGVGVAPALPPNACKLTECQGKPRCKTCLVMDGAAGVKEVPRG